ncbi:MAG: large repetitive protein [Solirubrobacteraceae bacterium]|jgi:hypothetical protein|nr:large repetitive protein [Solirubrobacteraceae bacterium]
MPAGSLTLLGGYTVFSRTRSTARARWLSRAATTTLGGFAALAAMPAAAPADIVEPPPLPHVMTVFPDRDFVSVEGYAPNTDMTIRVVRNGLTIGTAAGTTDGDGLLEVNHPGGVCWQGSTPNIIGQDKVVVTPTVTPADGDATTTQSVVAGQAFIEKDPVTQARTGRVIVKGTARKADGSPMDLGSVEQRIVNPALTSVPEVGRRDIRAVLGGDPRGGVLSADPAGGPGAFIAVYSQFSDSTDDLLVAGQTRVLAWQAANAGGDRLGITIHEVGEVGGPGFGGCPGGADYAVNDSQPANVTKALIDGGAPLGVSGVAQDADAVTVTLSDGDSSTTDPVTTVTPSPATGSQTWSATFTAAEVGALKDGTLTASGEYTVGANTIRGAEHRLAKDVIAPGAPTATPGSGTYATSQAVTLARPDPASRIRFTADGTDPTATSPLAPAQISVTSSQTIRAVAFDDVGNPSAVSAFAYTITTPGGTGATGAVGTPATAGSPSVTTTGTPASAAAAAAFGLPVVGGALAPRPQAGQPSVAPAADALAVTELALARRISVVRLRSTGLRIAMRLPAGSRVVRVRFHRIRNGRADRVAMAVVLRSPVTTGRYVLALRDRALLRRLRPGRYVAEVSAGRSRADLRRTARVTFSVTR